LVEFTKSMASVLTSPFQPSAVQPMTFMMTVHFVKIVNGHQHLERQEWPKV